MNNNRLSSDIPLTPIPRVKSPWKVSDFIAMRRGSPDKDLPLIPVGIEPPG